LAGVGGNTGCPCADPLLTTSHALATCTSEEQSTGLTASGAECCNSNEGGNAVHIGWGSCLSAMVTQGETNRPYPPTYGSQCQKHDEIGNEACFDQTLNVEHAVGDRTDPACESECPVVNANFRAGWCSDPWCYVDACNCNSAVTQSEYFVGQSIAFSYATCGSTDAFSATVTGGTQQATCASSDSGAHQQSPALTTLMFLVALTMGRMLPKL